MLGSVTDVAAVAVGSYGRRELSPESDLDIVLVHARPRDVAAIADRVWYPIWDAGFRLDHSVRTVREALDVADRDVKAMLGLIDARFVAGDAKLADELFRRTREAAHQRGRRWIPPLRADVQERHAKAGDVAFLLEPELKDGRGGLRDLTVQRALQAIVPEVMSEQSLLASSATLLSVRVALHRISGRPLDQLFLEHQDAVAEQLGYADADALMTAVAASAREIAWHLDDAWRIADKWLPGARRRRANPRPQLLAQGVELRDGEIDLAADARVEDAPALILDVARLGVEYGVPIARDALRRLSVEAPALTTVWSQHTRDAFLSLLGAGDATVGAFEDLERYELVSRILPEWSAVRGKIQRNAFHRFTVDRHLLETVARAGGMSRRVLRPDLLLIGALLHDIGKGFPGDHTDAGVVVADEIATRMGFEPDDVATIVAMVRHHLLLPAVATSRDLRDPHTIEDVASTLGSPQLLELLHALTEADSLSTGESAWSPWKAELIDELVWRVDRVFEGSHDSEPPSLDLDADDAALVDRSKGADLYVERSAASVTIVTRDRPMLFCHVVGVLAHLGQSVRGARARCRGQLAIDTFDVESSVGRVFEVDKFERELRRTFAGELQLDDELARRAGQYERLKRPAAARPADPRVLIDADARGAATIVQVRAADRIGLLYSITRVLAEHGLDIRHAKISTLGHEVVDTFYVVTAGAGTPVTDVAQLAGIEDALLPVLSPVAVAAH